MEIVSEMRELLSLDSAGVVKEARPNKLLRIYASHCDHVYQEKPSKVQTVNLEGTVGSSRLSHPEMMATTDSYRWNKCRPLMGRKVSNVLTVVSCQLRKRPISLRELCRFKEGEASIYMLGRKGNYTPITKPNVVASVVALEL